jgi:hypothetical protein
MNPTQAVQHEMERFLRSTEPEVLCITGAWGVGKTYTWQMALDRLRAIRVIGLSRYSYVSLFGVGSLEALKLSIFENLEFLVPQGRTGFEWMLSGGNILLKHSKKIMSVAGAVPKIGDALSKTQPLLFTTIRNQIVCIDDMERRSGITVKDVFGLVSYLREQRGCKIVLLLNQTKLDEDPDGRKAFADYFEKVIDTRLVFAPTATEAVAIAIGGNDDLSSLIVEYPRRLDGPSARQRIQAASPRYPAGQLLSFRLRKPQPAARGCANCAGRTAPGWRRRIPSQAGTVLRSGTPVQGARRSGNARDRR